MESLVSPARMAKMVIQVFLVEQESPEKLVIQVTLVNLVNLEQRENRVLQDPVVLMVKLEFQVQKESVVSLDHPEKKVSKVHKEAQASRVDREFLDHKVKLENLASVFLASMEQKEKRVNLDSLAKMESLVSLSTKDLEVHKVQKVNLACLDPQDPKVYLESN